MHYPQVQSWSGDASSTIQSALYAQVTVRMFYMPCGPVRLCHKCGKKIRNGALDKLQEETNSDFHHRGSLWTRLCRQ
ncbi:hypothetical protein CMV_008209 [Castanea mollissima]|uniref:Uncharacterized protein n=1 Tax=Castanea mollissima TaxID=60419 RepID=A0A8J4RKF9_9ROSI|nr:hypothetical protein CMV_008209 [Castanea mollissima]